MVTEDFQRTPVCRRQASKKLFDEANAMIDKIKQNNRLKLKGIFGFYPANSVGDDIVVYTDESRSTPQHTFYTLRQQAREGYG